MADNTRDKLIGVSVELIMLKGFNNTGIAEILSKAGVPKGSFYYYFKSKEDLGLAVIDHYGKLLSSGLEECSFSRRIFAVATASWAIWDRNWRSNQAPCGMRFTATTAAWKT
jgi:AcrR family transcriptional regulator